MQKHCAAMKVLIINGSPRVGGNTRVALNEIKKTLEADGVEAEIVALGTRPVRHCIACNQCMQHALNRCIFDDDVCNTISAKMDTADAIVIGSPVYYGQPNGGLMSLVQRMLYSAGSKFAGKPAAAVAICRRGGATAAYQTMLMPFEMMNMPIVTSQYWNIAYGLEKGESERDIEGMQTMRTLAHNLAWLLQKIHTGLGDAPQREPWQGMHFIR